MNWKYPLSVALSYIAFLAVIFIFGGGMVLTFWQSLAVMSLFVVWHGIAQIVEAINTINVGPHIINSVFDNCKTGVEIKNAKRQNKGA